MELKFEIDSGISETAATIVEILKFNQKKSVQPNLDNFLI
jgi:hypothetical protein